MKWVLLVLAVLSLVGLSAVVLSGCDRDEDGHTSPADVGQAVRKAATRTGQALEEGAKRTGQALRSASERTGELLGDATTRVAPFVEEARERTVAAYEAATRAVDPAVRKAGQVAERVAETARLAAGAARQAWSGPTTQPAAATRSAHEPHGADVPRPPAEDR